MSTAEVTQERSIGALFRHGATYSLVPIAAKVIAIAMVSLNTDWLFKDEFGVGQMVDLGLIFLVELLGVSAFQGMVRYHFEHEGERERRTVVSSMLLASTWISLLFAAGLIAAASATPALRTLLLGRTPPADPADLLLLTGTTSVLTADYLQHVVLLVCLLLPFQMATQASVKYLQIHHYSGLFSLIQIGKLLLEVGLKVWFVAPFGLDLGVKGMLLSVLVGEVLTSVGLGGWILSRVGFRVDVDILRPIVRYSIPLALASLCQLALHRSDTRLIELLLPRGAGLSAAAVYGIGYQMGYLANAMMLGPFMQIFLPWIYAVDERREQAALIAKLTTWVLVFYGFATAGVSLFAREAVLLIDRSFDRGYEEAYRVVPLVGGAYVFWAVYRATIETSHYVAKRTAPLTWFNLVALLVNIGLNWLWIPTHGIEGAAWATLVAFAVLALLGVIGSRRVLGVRLEHGRVLACLALVAVAGAAAVACDAALATPGRFSLAAAAAKAGALALVGGLLWAAVLRASEREDLLRWARAKLGRPA